MQTARMGCTHNKQQKSPLVPCRTVNGVLRVTIEEANIYKRSKVSSMDPYLRMTMSNQQFRGYIHKKADRKNLFNESFQFVINSCFKPEGRSLTIELWNKSLINDKIVGMGIIDIDPIIKLEQNTMLGSRLITVTKENQSSLQRSQMGMNDQLMMRRSYCKMKVFLNHGVEQVGYLNTVFEFVEQPITTIGLKFVYASLRRTSSIFTTMYCSVQAIAGQEILRTHKRKDQDTKNPPSWQDETLIFNIPKSLKDCVIRVLDDEKEVGHVRFNLGQVINKKGQHYFTEQLQHDEAISGVIKFCVMVGIQSVAVGSKRGSRVEQMIIKTQPNQQDQVRTQNQGEEHMYTEMKRQLPTEKSTRLQESEFRTFQNTHPTEEEPAREPFKELMKPNEMSPIRRLDNSVSQDKQGAKEAPIKVHRVDESAIVLNGQELRM